MSNNVIKFPRKRGVASKRSRRSLFYLGNHIYSGGPGASWCSRFWIKKLRDGTYYEIYSTTEETGSRRVYLDTMTREGVIDYFDGIGFQIADELAFALGLRTPIPQDAEILVLNNFRSA